MSAAQDAFVADSRVRASSRRLRERRSDCGCEKSTHLSATAGGRRLRLPDRFSRVFPLSPCTAFLPWCEKIRRPGENGLVREPMTRADLAAKTPGGRGLVRRPGSAVLCNHTPPMFLFEARRRCEWSG